MRKPREDAAAPHAPLQRHESSPAGDLPQRREEGGRGGRGSRGGGRGEGREAGGGGRRWKIPKTGTKDAPSPKGYPAPKNTQPDRQNTDKTRTDTKDPERRQTKSETGGRQRRCVGQSPPPPSPKGLRGNEAPRRGLTGPLPPKGGCTLPPRRARSHKGARKRVRKIADKEIETRSEIEPQLFTPRQKNERGGTLFQGRGLAAQFPPGPKNRTPRETSGE